MMYTVVTYANMRGVRAVDRIVELCKKTLRLSGLPKNRNQKEMHSMNSRIKTNC